jgi:hypothetical protein
MGVNANQSAKVCVGRITQKNTLEHTLSGLPKIKLNKKQHILFIAKPHEQDLTSLLAVLVAVIGRF